MNKAHNHQESKGEEMPSPDAAKSSADSVAAMIGTRNLKIVIITMPFVFLVVVGLIIAVFGRPGESNRTTSDATHMDVATGAGPGALSISNLSLDGSGGVILPKGAEIGSMAFDGDRLALHVDGRAGAMIVIYDLQQNIVVQTIPVIQGE